MLRRSLLLCVLVALVVPAVARADHRDGDASTGSFEPVLSLFVPDPFAGQPTDLGLWFRQRDHEAPVITSDLRVPDAWQFESGLSAIKPAQNQSGGAATACAHAVDGLGDNVRGNARIIRAEKIGAVAISAHLDGVTRTSPPSQPANDADAPITYLGDQAFISYDLANHRARLCVLATTGDARLTALPDPDPTTPGDELEPATEIVIDYALERTTVDATGVWRATLDLGPYVHHATVAMLNGSVVEVRSTLFGISAGNWGPKRLAVSVAPSTPGTATVKGVFSTCAPSGGSCASSRAPVTRLASVEIVVPEAAGHPIGRLLSPAPFSVITGTNQVPIVWLERLGSERPAGYLITLARPGQTDERWIYRERTMSGDAAYPCDAATKVCTRSLLFPLGIPGGFSLSQNGKYSVSVVTIFADGHRSDGRCDNGTALGVACNARLTHGPGWTHAEFLLRYKYWPIRFIDSETFDRRIDDDEVSHDVVLADPASGGMEYILWHFGAPAEVYTCPNGRVFQSEGDGAFHCFGQQSDLTQTFTIQGAFRGDEARAVLTRKATYLEVVSPPTPGDVLPSRRIGPIALPTNVSQPRTFHGLRI